ncbi:hypothetical protein EOM09_07955 [bacterium]|nr:hypothetical protein [bacterium]
MQTIRFYTDKNKYKGWQKLNITNNYLEWCTWLISGNTLKINSYTVKTKKELDYILKDKIK